jgi:hypothetical protein
LARNEQIVGARIAPEDYEVIEAAAFVRRLNHQALLRPVVEAFVEELRADGAVLAALQARALSDQGRGGQVVSMRGSKKTSKS